MLDALKLFQVQSVSPLLFELMTFPDQLANDARPIASHGLDNGVAEGHVTGVFNSHGRLGGHLQSWPVESYDESRQQRS